MQQANEKVCDLGIDSSFAIDRDYRSHKQDRSKDLLLFTFTQFLEQKLLTLHLASNAIIFFLFMAA